MMKAKYTSPRNSTDSSLNSSLKQAEEALQAEHNKLLSLMTAMEYTVTIQDKEYNIIYQNEASRIASGGDHLGEKCYRAYEGREKVCDGCPVEEAFKDGKSHTAERMVVTPSGEVTFWENTANPVRDSAGKTVSCLELAWDITERKRAEEKNRIILATALDGFFVVGLDARLLEVNASYCKMVGYTREELLKMSLADIEAIETPEENAQHIEKVAAQGYDFFETQHQRKDGKIIDVEVSANYIDVEGGQIVVFVRNITERKRAEEKNRIILATALDGFFVVGLDARLLEVNASYCKMVGYTREELLKMSLADIEAIETPEENAQHIEKVAAQGYDFFETQHQRKDGKIIDVEVSVNYIDVEGGQIVTFVRNITEHKLAEQALIESEGKYRTLVENIPQKIFFKDKDSVYISCNSNYAEDLQLKPAEISGHTDYDFYPRDLAEKYRADDKRVFESGNTERIEERYIEHGQERIVETFKAPFIDESGKTVGVLGIFHDITKQKETERQSHEREIAEVRAQELGMSQQRLINAQECLRKDIASQLHGTVQSRLILLGHKIAELEAKARSKRMTKELADVRQRLEELQNEHIRSISHRLFPSILRLGIATGLESLIDEYSAKLPVDLRVSKKLRDREQANRKLIPDNVKLALYRIAEEALTNISKHTPAANNIVVKLSLSDSRILRLTVRDDGPGSNTTSPSTGIGLLLISDYAAVAGGSCTIKSIPGKGTRITAVLPLVGLETGQ
ncbi:MAG: PAS domain S-box protein [Dehalococcoidia bacterium]|nr:MAG: PAS domain S-box protein [Dehalococcoidia bacterium]